METNRPNAYPSKKMFTVFSFEGIIPLEIILDSSMVEHSAVNRVVVGSSPTRGVICCLTNLYGAIAKR